MGKLGKLSIVLFLTACLAACGGVTVPSLPDGQSASPNALAYDGAITLSIKRGGTLPGTNLGYQGKAPDGRAIMTIGGLQALKSTADSVSWDGVIVPGSLVNLSLRVANYDNNSVNLFGTVHVGIQEPNPQGGDPAQNLITGFTIPVTYTVDKNTAIPGSVVQYLGKSEQGAQFSYIGQVPYVQQFDSVVWQGHLRDKVALRYDLRVINYSDDSATLVGTVRVMFEQ